MGRTERAAATCSDRDKDRDRATRQRGGEGIGARFTGNGTGENAQRTRRQRALRGGQECARAESDWSGLTLCGARARAERERVTAASICGYDAPDRGKPATRSIGGDEERGGAERDTALAASRALRRTGAVRAGE